MKYFALILTILYWCCTPLQAQIKKQYQDEKNDKTTVVVKEEGTSDLEILNNHFNLDDYDVNEQIMITTDGQVVSSKDDQPGDNPPPPDMATAVASNSDIPIIPEEEATPTQKAASAKESSPKKTISKTRQRNLKKLQKRKRRLNKTNRKKLRKRMKLKRKKKCYRF